MNASKGTGLAALLIVLMHLAACGGEAGGNDEPLFDEWVADDKCALLPESDLAAVTGVPENEWTVRSVSGCLYSWEGGSFWLGSIRVHDSVERARDSFARYTANATTEDLKTRKEALSERLREKSGQGEITEQQAAAGAAMMDAMPEDAIVYQALPDVGSQAALDNRGSMRVRYGNVVIWLTGKTGDRDWIDPDIASELGRRMAANLQAR